MPSPDEIRQNAITLGRAYVRLLEAVDILLERRPAWTERLVLRFVRALYTHRLRGLVEVLPPDITAEILSASEKILATVTGFSRN